ncbi:hypothetical protein NL676_012204 [Syzygium grande]|nr:hypothetical protein NL676_012204 [Syzygium grande]
MTPTLLCKALRTSPQLRRRKLRASAIMESSGFDSKERELKNAAEMWRDGKEGDGHKRKEWYRQGVGYWEGCNFTITLSLSLSPLALFRFSLPS